MIRPSGKSLILKKCCRSVVVGVAMMLLPVSLIKKIFWMADKAMISCSADVRQILMYLESGMILIRLLKSATTNLLTVQSIESSLAH